MGVLENHEAEGASEPPELPTAHTDKPSGPPEAKTPSASPGRRATRSRIKLAANFCFAADL